MARQTGTVAKWLNHKGIGFITPEGEEAGENDILVHYEQIKQGSGEDFKSLEQGSTVEYELQQDPKNEDKHIAVNVTGPGGEDCTAKTRRPQRSGNKGGRKVNKGRRGPREDREPREKREKGDHSHFKNTDEVKHGTVAKWINFRGIGFITMDGEEPGKSDILVHYEEIKQGDGDGFRSLMEESRVWFNLKPDPKDESMFVAYNVTGPDGADCEARPKGYRRGPRGKRSAESDEE
jgi:cold shock CspA family protein